jgi:hypothetical protein
MSHGGDNFQFRASGFNPFMTGLDDCVVGGPSQTFTVWRKMRLNYAWMRDRENEFPYPACPELPTEKEYRGVHHINNGDFSKVKGVFDDCFIEIEPATHYQNTPYQLYNQLQEALVYYGDTYTLFRPNPPPDTVVLLGIDHFSNQCPQIGVDEQGNPIYSSFGRMVPHWAEYSWRDAFYNYAAVGHIHDWLQINEAAEIDRAATDDPQIIILGTSSAELTHCFTSVGDEIHSNCYYGLMCHDDKRSYLHEDHIMLLRSGIPKFDTNQY